MSVTHPRQSRRFCISLGILFGTVASVSLANVYLGLGSPYNFFAPKCSGAASGPCFGCTCSPTPSWKPPVVTFVQTYPLLSALLLLASVVIAVAGFFFARRRDRALNPLFLMLPVITLTVLALVAIVLWWIAVHVPGEICCCQTHEIPRGFSSPMGATKNALPGIPRKGCL